MKLICFFAVLLLTSFGAVSPTLFAQDKQLDLELKNTDFPIDIIEGSDNCFYVLCEEKVIKNILSNVIYKFDADLNPVWDEAVVLNNSFMKAQWSSGSDISIFSYKNPTDNTNYEYILQNWTVFQISADGSLIEVELDMPAAEKNKKIAKIFLNDDGLNIITLTGDRSFPTGKMNWYTFAHDDLTQSVRTMTLPLPSNIDKKNESGWRLNEVTSTGLYFYYVAYKNEVRDETRPILSCHIIHVNPEGEAGEMMTIETGLEKYSAIPLSFEQDVYTNLNIYQPDLYESGVNGGGTWYYIPTDNAYMGVKIDENTERIYTVVALNDDLDVSKDGRISGGAMGRHPQIQYLSVSAYDLDGKNISQTQLEYTPLKLGPSDDWSSRGNHIKTNPLPKTEGVIYRLLLNGNGHIWALNDQGETIQELKTEPFEYTKQTVKYKYDVFTSSYFSIQDFRDSPYALKRESAPYQYFNQLDDKSKRESYYLSLEGYELVAVWDKKSNVLELNSFTKKSMDTE